MSPVSNRWHLYIPKLVTCLRDGYGWRDLKTDAISGLTVAIVALPLAMALAIASGTSPDKGLLTAIIAGFLISALGGSRFQIGGPTGAFVVVVFNVISQFGYSGLVTATMIAGGLLIIAGLLGFGTFIKYIPHPVVTGFTSGIAVIIFTSQIKDFFGLDIASLPVDFIDKILTLSHNITNSDSKTVIVAMATLTLIFILRQITPRLPAFLLAVIVMSALSAVFGLDIVTINSKFGGISATIAMPELPDFSKQQVIAVFPSALTIAFLAGIESLLSAVVADGMTGRKHRSNCELIAQGIANSASALFGGMPATGAIARTATNIRSGAKTPVSGVLHAIFLLGFVLFFAPLAGYIPLACLSAVLMVVAWNMSEFHKFIHLFRSPLGDRLVLICTFCLTVLVDLNLAIEVGVVFSAILFMHRMANAVVTQTQSLLIQQDEDDLAPRPVKTNLPLSGTVQCFQFNGPFFFGAAERLVEVLSRTGTAPRGLVLQMRDVPFIDATGCAALASFLDIASHNGTIVYFCEANAEVTKTMTKMHIGEQRPNVCFCESFEKALKSAEIL